MTTDAEKKCPHCGKKLRKDNTRGACSNCLASGKTSKAVDTAEGPRRRPKSDALKRFRTVADALGFDSEALLDEFAEAWLAALRERAGEK